MPGSFPEPIAGPGNRQIVGIDRGVAVSAALSTGEMLTAPGLSARRQLRLRRLQRLRRRLARARRGSNRRARVKWAVAGLRAREADARKDWAEPGDPAVGLGPAGAPAGGKGPRPGGEGHTDVNAAINIAAGMP
jgi:transposase